MRIQVIISFMLLLFTNCAQIQQSVHDTSETSASSGTTTAQPNCRKYATSYATGGNTYTCTWNGSALQYVCTGNGNTYTYQYSSLQKFVDEPKIVGRFYFSSLTITGSGPSTTSNSYDASDRLTLITINAGTAVLTYAYSSYDSQGRPLAGLYNISASGFTCVNATLARTYSDSARTMSEAVTGGTGILCSNLTTTSTYDAITGAELSTVSVPGSAVTRTVNSSAQVCQ